MSVWHSFPVAILSVYLGRPPSGTLSVMRGIVTGIYRNVNFADNCPEFFGGLS